MLFKKYKKVLFINSPYQATLKEAAGFGVNNNTILIHSEHIGKVKKLEKCNSAYTR